jgi:mRNA-degrading endonuclease YafQ of YafQ-DinJ toxin-antitoxin module
MRRIERTGAFQKDFKREKRGQHRRDIYSLVSDVVSLLAEDKRFRRRIATTLSPGSGMTIANATSSQICC